MRIHSVKIIAIGLLLFSLCAPLGAAPKAFITGAELLRLCESAAASQFTRATDCLGYITGLSDTHEAFVDLNTFKRQWCWPAEGISNRQMARVVYDYLQANFVLLDKSAALLTSFALLDAYPCG